MDVIGNPEAQRRLRLLGLCKKSDLHNSSSGQEDKKPNLGLALLFHGPKGIGKAFLAKTWALDVLKKSSRIDVNLWESHPDLHLFKPQGKLALHTIDSMKHLVSQVFLPPTLSTFKVFILQDAERLPDIAANFLLKTLEEPPEDTLFILTSSDPEKLLTTLKSRCQKVPFFPVDEKEIASWLEQSFEVGSKEAEALAKASRGSPARARRLAQELSEEFLQTFTVGMRRLFSGDMGLVSMADFATYLEKHIEDQKAHLEKELLARFDDQKERFTPLVAEMQQKQIEGEAALFKSELIDELFELILFFVRDLSLLQLSQEAPGLEKGLEEYKLFPLPIDMSIAYKKEEVGKWLQSSQLALGTFIQSLAHIENLLIEAKSSLRYSIKLSSSLMRLFLKI